MCFGVLWHDKNKKNSGIKIRKNLENCEKIDTSKLVWLDFLGESNWATDRTKEL